MTEALTRPKPRIDHPEELDRIVKQIVAEVDPVAIYLFGSRARGDADDDSDYDLMIVVPDRTPIDRGLYDRVWKMARAPRIGATPFLSRAHSFAWRRHEVGTLEYEVEIDGLQLYPERGQPFRRSAARGTRAMSVNVVQEWLRRVEKDLTMARKGCEGDDAVPDQAAYHVQQAAEKLTKAALVAHEVRPQKGHKIEEFAPLLPDDFLLKARFRELERFSDFAWAYRYPEYPGQERIPEPTIAEVRDWIAELKALKADFERWLEQAAGGEKRG
jgi:HEPN domain-containing protein